MLVMAETYLMKVWWNKRCTVITLLFIAVSPQKSLRLRFIVQSKNQIKCFIQKVKSGHSKASMRVFCVFGLQENPLMKPNRIPLKSQSWQIRIPIQSSGQTCPTKSTCQSLGWREISLRKSIAFQYKSSKGIYGDRVTFRFKYRCWLDHSFLVYKNQTRMSPQKWSNSETNDSAQLLLYHYNIKEYNLCRSLFSNKTSHESYHGPWCTLYYHKTDE